MANIIGIFSEILKNPYRIVGILGNRNMFHWMNDELYLKLVYKGFYGHFPDLKKPKPFNEKLQWFKLNDHNPLYNKLVDKFEVKKYIAETIGAEYVIPLLGIWEKFDDIDFNSLPKQFVLKCTHDSGGIVFCKDKSKFDIDAAKQKLAKCLNRNYYWQNREWPYKNVKPRIIAEQYMVDESGTELKDYKIFNFNGKSKIIQVDWDRFIGHKCNFYTTDWQYIDASLGTFPTHPEKRIEKPKQLKTMLELAEKLSAGFPFVRTDFYCIEDKIYFGELTFYPGSGFVKLAPGEFDLRLGEWLKLPEGIY